MNRSNYTLRHQRYGCIHNILLLVFQVNMTTFSDIIQAKSAVKREIKEWLENFEKENGVKPTNSDKEKIKDKYKSLKQVSIN